MTETSEGQASENQTMTTTEKAHAVVSRVLNLSIFFVGIGVYAIAGFGLQQIGLFSNYQQTYFAVGVVFGAIGLLLYLLTR